MAFDKLGFLLTIEGVDRFLGDLQRINSSLSRYNNAVSAVQRAASIAYQQQAKSARLALLTVQRANQALIISQEKAALQSQIQAQRSANAQLVASNRTVLANQNAVNSIEKALLKITTANRQMRVVLTKAIPTSNWKDFANNTNDTFGKTFAKILSSAQSFSVKYRGVLLSSTQQTGIENALRRYQVAIVKFQAGIIPQASVTRAFTTLNNYILRTTGATKAQKDVTTQLTTAQNNLTASQSRNRTMQAGLATAQTNVYNQTRKLTAEQQKQIKIQAQMNAERQRAIIANVQSQNSIQKLSTFISILTGEFQSNLKAQGLYSSSLVNSVLKTVALSLSLSSLQVVLGAIRMGFTILSNVVSIASKVFGTIFGWIGKIATSFWNLATGALKLVWQGFVKLVSIPFNFISNAFKNLFDIIKNFITIGLGISFDRFMYSLATKLRDLAGNVFDAAAQFQLLEVRMRGLLAREYVEGGVVKNFNEGLLLASENTQELLKWISMLALKSPFTIEDVASTYTLAQSYGFVTEEAKKVTKAIVDFSAGMGVGNDVIVRVVENFGQMIMAGKVTGTELRDLARGAFLPNSRIFAIMAENLGLTKDQAVKMTPALAKVASELKVMAAAGDSEGKYVKEFILAFQEMVERDFPNAAARMTDTWQVATSNVKDFFEAFIGGLAIKPALDVISKRVSSFVNLLVSEKNYNRFVEIGKSLSNIVEGIFRISDSITGDVGAYVDKFFEDLQRGFSLVSDFFTGMNTEVPETFMVNGVMKYSMTGKRKDLSKFYENLLSSGWVDADFAKSFIKPLIEKIERGDWSGAFTSLKEIIFQNVLPAIGFSIDDFLTKKLPIYTSKLWSGISKIWEFFTTELWPEISPKIADWLTVQFNTGKAAIAPVLRTIGDDILTWASSQEGVLGSMGKFIGNIVKALGLDLGTEYSTEGMPIDIFGDQSKNIKSSSSNLSRVIKQALDDVATTINSWVENNTGLPGNVYKTVAGVFESLASYFDPGSAGQENIYFPGITVVSNKKKSIVDTISGVVDGITTSLDKLNRIDLSNFEKNITPFLDYMEHVIAGVVFLERVAEAIGKQSEAIGKMVEVVGKIVAAPFQILGAILTPFKPDTTGKGVSDFAFGYFETMKNMWQGVSDFFGEISTKITEVVNTVIEEITRMKTEGIKVTNGFKEENIETWQLLADDLVTHSIVPDMMNDIFDTINEKLIEINTITLINTGIFKGYFDPIEMRTVGQNFIQGLYDGLSSKWYIIQDWWNTHIVPMLNTLSELGLNITGSSNNPPSDVIDNDDSNSVASSSTPYVQNIVAPLISNPLSSNSVQSGYNVNMYNTLSSNESISILAYEVAREIRRRG